MPRRIKSVRADPRTFTLRIVWATRAVTTKGMKPLIQGRRAFAALADPRVFARAKVIDGGNAIAWPGTDADYAADALWYEARPHDNPFADAVMTAEQLKRWMAELGFSLSSAALALGLSRRQVAAYASGEKSVPRLVFLACMALASPRARRRRAA